MKDQELEQKLEIIAADLALISAVLLHQYRETNSLLKNGVNWDSWGIKGFTRLDEVDVINSKVEDIRKGMADKIHLIGGVEYVAKADAQEWRAKHG